MRHEPLDPDVPSAAQSRAVVGVGQSEQHADRLVAAGDGTFRTVALADRVEELGEVVARGRAAHRAWIEEVFAPQLRRRRGAARERVLRLLVTVLDVTTWKTLRRDEELDPRKTGAHLRALVEAALAA